MKSAFEHSGNKLIYHWRESIGSMIFLTVFALLWNVLVFFMLYSFATGSASSINDVPYTSFADAFQDSPIIIVFTLFPLVGLGVGYAALCSWVNQTSFSADGMNLIKKTSPLPVTGDFVVSRTNIIKVFVRLGPTPQTRSKANPYTVVAHLNDGNDKIIHSAGLTFEDATVLEKWIKERLNLS